MLIGLSYYLSQKVIFLFQSLLVFIVPLTYNFTHSGLRLYQYNEDDFYLSVLISDKLFTNCKLYNCKQTKNCWLKASFCFLVYLYSCCLNTLLKSKIETESVFILLIYTTTIVKKSNFSVILKGWDLEITTVRIYFNLFHTLGF